MKRLKVPQIRLPRPREALLATFLMGMLAVGGRLGSGNSTALDTSLFSAETASPVTPETGDAQATPSTATSDETSGVFYNENAGGGGAKNIVRMVNRQDDRLRVKGNVQLNRIPGPTVAPSNLALAYSSCTDCQTFSVALQINLISRGASSVHPENVAVALNYECTRCHTVAHALQYVFSVDDPTIVPQEAKDLIKAMDQELNAIRADKSITVTEAEARINAVIAQFKTVAADLRESRDETGDTTTPGATSEP